MTEPREAFVHFKIQNPLVAWLVYRGEMASGGVADESTLSFWLMDSLRNVSAGRRGAVYQAELGLEARRAESFQGAVPRLQAFYAFDDSESAQRAIDHWGFLAPESVTPIEISANSRISRHDAEWITHHLGKDHSSAWVDAYLAGEARSDEPVWELLIDGRAIVYGTELREAAYQTVREEWPASLPLLELSRIGVELGSDLGLIAPMLHGGPNDLRVDFRMSFADAKDPDFLARLGSFEGPKNTNDLTPDSDLIRPDLQDRGFSLTE